MTHRDDLREFLTSRRAKLTPHRAGLSAGANRRVPGLRRAEVAMLADVSVEYYTQMERGNLAGVSETVLDALARALQLDDAERSHLFDLARTANTSPARARRPSRTPHLRPTVQYVLDAITGAAAVVRNRRMDILAANQLGRALYSPMYLRPQRPANLARFQFLDRDRAELFYPDWERAADYSVAILRTEAGRDPYDKDLQDLIGELSTLSADFRARWAAHNVRRHSTGTKHLRHPAVGDLHLTYQATELVDDPRLSLLIYVAEPGTPDADNLRLLASWAATQDQDQPNPAATFTDPN